MNHVQDYLQRHFATLVDDVENGNESALKAFAVLKQADNFINECIDQIKLIAVNEAEKFGAKSFDSNGLKFELREGSRVWDFSNSDTWVAKKNELKEIEQQLKLMAETKANIGQDLITEDGEVLEAAKFSFRSPSLILKG
jgi:hypothetical protein